MQPDAKETGANRRQANRVLVEALLGLWDRVPDQRFGQLVMNLSREPGVFPDTWEWSNADWHRRIEEAMRTWAT